MPGAWSRGTPRLVRNRASRLEARGAAQSPASGRDSATRVPAPVYAGDTLRAVTEVLAKRESRSRPDRGIVTVRTRGLNQREEVVIEFERTIMVARRP